MRLASFRALLYYAAFLLVTVVSGYSSEAGERICISVIYYSDSGNTRRMAETLVDGLERTDGVEARAFSLDALDAEYIKASKCVIFGTPTHMADMTPALKQWFVEKAKDFNLGGKIGGVFATANYYHGGSELAMQNLVIQMLVKGMLVYSGGSSFGVPIIHVGPVAFGGKLEESEELFLIYGERISQQTAELFK